MKKEDFKDIVFALRVMSVKLGVIANSKDLHNYVSTIDQTSERLYQITEILDSSFYLNLPDAEKILKDAEETMELQRMYNL